MITRVLAGQATQAAAKDSTVGLLLSLGTQATLTAMDTPDTRSWETLPARVAIGRLRVPPGKHDVVITVGGRGIRRPVDIAPNGFAVATLTVLQ
jgi:hypothetical protein